MVSEKYKDELRKFNIFYEMLDAVDRQIIQALYEEGLSPKMAAMTLRY